MLPNIVIFNKEIPFYSVFALIGIFAVLGYTQALAKKRKSNDIDMLCIMLWSFVGVFVGGHILYGITNIKIIARLPELLSKCKGFFDVVYIFGQIFGGAVFYGGLLGAMLVCFIYIKKKKLDYAEYVDVAASSIPLFHFFGRLGCFSSGCCYGVESPVGFVMHHSPAADANGVTRFPVQLVEAGCNLIIFLVLYFLIKKGKAKGKILDIYLLSYAPVRFILEFFRGDAIRGFVGPFSTSQFISLLIIVAVIPIMIIRHKKETRIFSENRAN